MPSFWTVCWKLSRVISTVASPMISSSCEAASLGASVVITPFDPARGKRIRGVAEPATPRPCRRSRYRVVLSVDEPVVSLEPDEPVEPPVDEPELVSEDEPVP